MQNQSKINWRISSFFIATPIIAIVGTILLMTHSQIAHQTWMLALFMLVMSGLAITTGYHRLYSHKSLKAAWPVRLLFALFGAACFEGSILEWSTDHRIHHRYVDTEKDPYNINAGFWFAHIIWLFKLDQSKRNFDNVSDLMQDPIVRFQHRFYLPIATTMSFILPTAVAALWGDAIGGLIIAGFLRMVLNHHGTFCINSVCHVFGKRIYSTEQTARDNWFTALFTWGEGFHNFHHQFALDYRNGIRWFHYDPGKWLIWLLKSVGLVHDLKRVDDETILKYKLRAQARQMNISENTSPDATTSKIQIKCQEMHDMILEKAANLKALKKELIDIKASQFKARLSQSHEQHKQAVKDCRQNIRSAQKEVKKLFAHWQLLMKEAALGKVS